MAVVDKAGETAPTGGYVLLWPHWTSTGDSHDPITAELAVEPDRILVQVGTPGVRIDPDVAQRIGNRNDG